VGWDNLDPKILRYVTMVANVKNFSKAAQQLHLSQPSLSYQINRIEKELGVKLFNRGQGGISLTYAGEIFVNRSVEIIDKFEQLKNEMFDLADLKHGQLVIGSTVTTGALLLPETISQFKNVYPGIEIVLHEDTTVNLELLVSQSQVEICLLSKPILNTELETEEILDEEIFLAVPSSHSFAKLKEIDLKMCKDEGFILLKNSSGFRTTTENLCKEAGFKPKLVFESANIKTCQSFTSAGMGITFVPKMGVEPHKNLVYLSLKNEFKYKRQVLIAYKNKREISKAARVFIDILKSVGNNI
jgi:LysR family transcriptional regulator, hydrogen peroxide-inducible genes activator